MCFPWSSTSNVRLFTEHSQSPQGTAVVVHCSHPHFPHRLGLPHHYAVPKPPLPPVLQSQFLPEPLLSLIRISLSLVAMSSPWLVCYLSFHIWTHPHGSQVPCWPFSNQQTWPPPRSSKQGCMGMTPDVVFIVCRLCPGTSIILWIP